MARFAEVKVASGDWIMINPNMIVTIEPSPNRYKDETDIYFSQRVITISLSYERAVKLLSTTD